MPALRVSPGILLSWLWESMMFFIWQNGKKGAPLPLIFIESFNPRQMILKRKKSRSRSSAKANWFQGQRCGWSIEVKRFRLISFSARPSSTKSEDFRFIQPALICRARDHLIRIEKNNHVLIPFIRNRRFYEYTL